VAHPSPIQYARCGQAYVAYRTCGDDATGIVLLSDWFGNVDEMWSPASPLRPVLEQLASFGRLVTFDRRGVGLSDPVALESLPTLEQWMDDVGAVMDACGMGQAAVIAKGSGGAVGLLFAASHPERVSALALVNSFARLSRADDYPIGVPVERGDDLLREIYPPAGSARVLAGGSIDDATVAWWDRYLRLSASPGTTLAMRRMLFDVDVRAILPAVQVPTLVVHRADDAWIRATHGRYLAEHVPGARLVVLPGASDLLFAGDQSDLVAEIQEFITGTRPRATGDRVLATVLFTDIIGSTQRAAKQGDHAWRGVLDQFEAAVRAELQRFTGREVKMVGDEVVAIFDGPARAIRCADAIRTALASLHIEVRSGLHSGEIELRGDDIGGIAVHIGARISALASANEILVSRTVKDLVAGSGITFEDRGMHELKGVPDEWQVLAANP
jgi:pimeloyl-ACP methyl ester carboxylesterase